MVRLALVLVALLLGAPAFAQKRQAPQLQPPSPSSREQIKPPQHKPAHEEQNAQPDRRGTIDAPLVVEMHYPPKTEQQAAENAAEQERKASTDWWTTVLTGSLVAATVLQFGALGYQGYWLRRTVRIAEGGLTILERPFLVIDVISAGMSRLPPEGGELTIGASGQRFVWQAINYGRTPAVLIDAKLTWPVEAGNAMPHRILATEPADEKFPIGSVSGLNKPYESVVDLLEKIDNTFHERGALTGYVPYFSGYIRYGDIFGGVYISGFCFKYDPEWFKRVGGEDYNYFRTEKKPNPNKAA